jgi:hypothetical protein
MQRGLDIPIGLPQYNFSGAIQDIAYTYGLAVDKTSKVPIGQLKTFPIVKGSGGIIGGITGLGKLPGAMSAMTPLPIVPLKEPFGGSALGTASSGLGAMGGVLQQVANKPSLGASLSNSKPGSKSKDPSVDPRTLRPNFLPTTTVLRCTRTSVIDVTCTARVANTSINFPAAPTGTVEFSVPGGGGFFPNGTTCQLGSVAPDASECQLAFETQPVPTNVAATYRPNVQSFTTSNALVTVP